MIKLFLLALVVLNALWSANAEGETEAEAESRVICEVQNARLMSSTGMCYWKAPVFDNPKKPGTYHCTFGDGDDDDLAVVHDEETNTFIKDLMAPDDQVLIGLFFTSGTGVWSDGSALNFTKLEQSSTQGKHTSLQESGYWRRLDYSDDQAEMYGICQRKAKTLKKCEEGTFFAGTSLCYWQTKGVSRATQARYNCQNSLPYLNSDMAVVPDEATNNFLKGLMSGEKAYIGLLLPSKRWTDDSAFSFSKLTGDVQRRGRTILALLKKDGTWFQDRAGTMATVLCQSEPNF